MKLVVCDDVKEDAEITINIIDDYMKKDHKDYSVDFYLPNDLNKEIQEGNFKYDIAVLDIDYSEEKFNGIDLAGKINEVCPQCNIIYLTAILDFASDVYETEHCYFVMKKNQKLTMNRALDKAVKLVDEYNKSKVIKIISSGKEILISTEDIRYITRENRKIKIVGEACFESYISLNDCLEILPKKYVRCHTGYIVNMDFIKAVEGNKIVLSDDVEIPVGRVYKDSFMMDYLDYLERRV